MITADKSQHRENGLVNKIKKLEGGQGRGPKGVDDLCFHPFGEFYLSPPSPSPLKSQSQGPNPNLKGGIPISRPKPQILDLRPKSLPGGPDPSLEAQISSSRLGSGPLGWNLDLKAEI